MAVIGLLCQTVQQDLGAAVTPETLQTTPHVNVLTNSLLPLN